MSIHFHKFVVTALLIIMSRPLFAADLTAERINIILSQIPTLIEKHHVDRQRAAEIARQIQTKINAGEYHHLSKPQELANAFSRDLKQISNDGHLYLRYTEPAKSDKDASTEDWEAAERAAEIRLNYGFVQVEVMEGNIGYLKIREWMHPKRSMPTAVAAMKLVENTSALIIDLRDNGGGYPGVMEYILNHYFDGPPELLSTTYYSDDKTLPHTRYTSDLVYGKLLIGKPLYVLVNQDSASASEFFAYTLQAFKKAKVVGEGSAGAANMNSYFPIDNQFRLSVSTAMPVNSVTGTNWEVIGITPDIKTAAGAELQAALAHLKQGTQK